MPKDGAEIIHTDKGILIFDTETDPFAHGMEVKPFTCNFFDGHNHTTFWGDDCIEQAVGWIKELKHPYIIYAHNGGNFDFYFMLEHIEEDCLLINNRIVQAHIAGQELRDSYAIFPDPLSAYKKDDFDYRKMDKRVRKNHKNDIIYYMKRDCVYLFEAVTRFHDEFGDHLTIGSCAMKQLNMLHKFDRVKDTFDKNLRPFYFGGRNQCFETGIIKNGPFEMIDVNNMYGDVMRNVRHPTGLANTIGTTITDKTFFARIIAKNYGCLPVRKKVGLDFTQEYGEFFAGIHEINAGLETGTLVIERVKHTRDFDETGTFDEFIDKFVGKRMKARAEGDKLGDLNYKRIPNSSYGKMSQDPRDYRDCKITRNRILPYPYELMKETNNFMIWGKPTPYKSFYNVAIGASITSAARAKLHRAICKVVRPIYCDTDSLICESMEGLEISPDKLGAWKHEGTITSLAIAGKKLYVARGTFGKGKTEKKAHKGAVLSGNQIFSIARGATIEYASEAPKFRMVDKEEGEKTGKIYKSVFVKRRITSTETRLKNEAERTKKRKAA